VLGAAYTEAAAGAGALILGILMMAAPRWWARRFPGSAGRTAKGDPAPGSAVWRFRVSGALGALLGLVLIVDAMRMIF
jgi:hypothetical protein